MAQTAGGGQNSLRQVTGGGIVNSKGRPVRSGVTPAPRRNTSRKGPRKPLQSTPRRSGGGDGFTGGGGGGGYLGSGGIADVIRAAMEQQGVDYAWGGGGLSGPSRGFDHGSKYYGFDCSSLMQYVFNRAGVRLPRVSREQAKVGVGVDTRDAKPGDMVFFDRDPRRPGIDHVALYLGNGKILEAPRTGLKVRIANVDLSRVTAIRRVIDQDINYDPTKKKQAGDFARFVHAITEQESGGRWDAVGERTRSGDRAYGKYQIMGANIPSWTKEFLGVSLTPQQFLKDKNAQFRVAEGRLRQYYNKYGAAGAAAAWYGGDKGAKKYLAGKDVVGQNGPMLRTYVDEVMSRMRRSTVGRSGEDLTRAIANAPGKDGVMSREDLAAAFAAAGYSAALINSNPELKRKFEQGIKQRWTGERFANEIKNTQWFRGRTDKQRADDTLRMTDPKSWQHNLDQLRLNIQTNASEMGINISESRVNQIARSAQRNGFSEQELRNAVVAEFSYDPKKVYKGEAGNTINQVRDLSYAYGVRPTSGIIARNVRGILRGENSVEGLRNGYVQEAKSRYAHFANDLDAGRTLEEIADPYMRQVRETLEIEDVDLFDKTVQQGLLKKDPKTNATSAMTLYEYEEALKNDQRWMRTNNARESMMGVGQEILRSFGLVT